MKKFILSFLSLIATAAPAAPIDYGAIGKGITKSATTVLQMYGSYRLLFNQKTKMDTVAAILVNIPLMYSASTLNHFIDHISLDNGVLSINFNTLFDNLGQDGPKQLLPFLSHTLGLAIIVQLAKNR